MQEIMTDYQFKAIINMVIFLAKKCASIDELIKELEKLKEGK